LRLIEGMELALKGKSAAEVRAKWSEALRGGRRLEPLFAEFFEKHFGESFYR
tara:strand:+ start:677 stop:832 length:156 start_codon:yes stop_codon:yes gene_type:complete